MTENGRLNVGIIGAGPVGAVLGLALAGAGHLVVGISAVSQENRERAEALTQAQFDALVLGLPWQRIGEAGVITVV